MADKIGGKKIGSVKSTKEATSVEGADAVSIVGEVKATSGITGIRTLSGISDRRRKQTRTMTSEERERLFKLIEEEAESLFSQGGLPESQKEVVKSAVMMAVDAGIIIDDSKKDSENE